MSDLKNNVLLVLIAFFVLAAVSLLLVAPLFRHVRAIRRSRKTCPFCGGEKLKWKYLRVEIPDEPHFVSLRGRGKFFCQTNRFCQTSTCPVFDRWDNQVSEFKDFGLVHRTFHPQECRPNATFEDLIGPWKPMLMKIKQKK